jgi:NAD(P)H-dependent flavin oxidoreductase YrpB (nitropropane dioxygenase family)
MEAPVHDNVKQALVKATEFDTVLLMRALRNTERLKRRHVLFGAAARSLHRLDATLPDHGDVFRIGRRGEAWQEG